MAVVGNAGHEYIQKNRRMLLSLILTPIRKRKMKILNFTSTRITEISKEKAKAAVAKVLAEVTAKIGTAAKEMAVNAKAKEKERTFRFERTWVWRERRG